jgi:multidrug efflux pump subunit AcrB
MGALLIAGAYSVIVIPKESAPEVIVPIGIVSTPFPGASAADVEQLVTNKIEDATDNLDNVNKVTSQSRSGLSMVTVEFSANADVDKSIEDLKNAIDTAKPELPDDANDPQVVKVNFADQPIIVLSVSSDVLPSEFTRFAKDVERELEEVSGVSRVDVAGVRKRETQVVVNPEALQTFGLSLQDVIFGISAANATLPIGTITTGGVEYALQYEGDIEDPELVRDIAIASVGGKPVFVRDVATVSTGVERASTISRVSVDGAVAENAATFYVFKRSGGDVTKTAAAVRDRIDELKQPGGLLETSSTLISLDLGKDVEQDLKELVTAGLETVFLVMAALLLTIGWRESLVAGLSIPLSFVIAFIALLASGNTINFVSLFSLILAVGILVDSGIVVTEAIHTRMRAKGSPVEAAELAIREYAWPLIGGTMTTVAVFAPLFFISGIVGEFIKSIPFTIIFVLLASIFVALGLVPLIATKITKASSANRLEEKQEEWTHRAQDWYQKRLRAFLLKRRAQNWFIASLVVGLVAAFMLPVTGIVKTVFFPGEDVDYVYLEIEAKRGTPLQETDLAIRTIEELLYEKDYVESFTSTAGGSSPFTGATGGAMSGSVFGNITVELKSDRDITSSEAVKDLRALLSEVSSVDARVIEQENGPPGGAPVAIKFFGDDLGELGKVAERAQGILESIPGTTDVSASTKNLGTEFVFRVDSAKASALGLTSRDVAQTLRTAVFGSAATTIRTSGDDIDVVVKLALDPTYTDPTETTNVSVDALKNIAVTTRTGTILLGSVLEDSIEPSNTSIAHEDGRRVESVSAYITPDVTATEVVNEFKKRESELNLSPDMSVSYGGETEDVNQSFAEMGYALIAGLVLMLAILVLAFNSIRYSLYLLATVPLSLIGVFAGLAIMREPLSFTSLLGVVALAGVIINHAIILMDSLIVYRKQRTGEPLIDTVVFASATRLRPIFLTTITTVLGMIPLSRISEFWSPLAYAIMYGLSFAMILTLIFIPALFYRNEMRKDQIAQGIYIPKRTRFMKWIRSKLWN